MKKVFHKFTELHSKVSLHLVEVSPALSKIQEKTLTGRFLTSHQDGKERQDDTSDKKLPSSEVKSINLFLN